MRWILVGVLAAAMLAGCRQSGEPAAETNANQQAATTGDAAAAGEEQASAGTESPWGEPTSEPQSDQPRTGTGSVDEQQQVQAELLDEDDEARQEQGATQPEEEQQAAAEVPGDTDGGVYEFGESIEPGGDEQLGISDGHIAAVDGQNLAVVTSEGEEVDLVIADDALVVMEGAPADPSRLAELGQGTPIRAEYSLEDGQNVARRIEIPVEEEAAEP